MLRTITSEVRGTQNIPVYFSPSGLHTWESAGP
jgi:hypothetical protein